MGKVIFSFSISPDGGSAGPDGGPEHLLGRAAGQIPQAQVRLVSSGGVAHLPDRVVG